MAQPQWPTRFLRAIGTRAYLRISWYDAACPNSYGKGAAGYHNAQRFLAETTVLENWEFGGAPSDHPEAAWPVKCDHCPAIAPPQTVTQRCCSQPGCNAIRPQVTRSVHHRILYEAQDGSRKVRDELEPGDMYWATWYGCANAEPKGHCIHGWTNCDGKHLIVILPSKHNHPWDPDGRASNCGLKNDTTHRCWVRNGDPETGKVHVDKGPIGHISTTTCSAGAGSIQADGWHGFLHRGILR